jgi:acyl-CoA synthetase (AMP-forming)/AMP-acid ligase II
MAIQSLHGLLESTVENFTTGRAISSSMGNTQRRKAITYAALLNEAQRNGDILRSLEGFQAGSVVLLHLTDQLSGIIWFWSVLYAGGLPAMSTPFSNNSNHRILHIEHLLKLLKHPFYVTSGDSLDNFSGQEFLRPITIESLKEAAVSPSGQPRKEPCIEDTALLMLTSGSTGNAKAVCLSHGQIVAAVAGKSSVVLLPRKGSFLNWIALDHVASLVEIHLQALFLVWTRSMFKLPISS